MTSLASIDRLNSFDIVLASKSPRRQHLLSELGLKFRVIDHIDMEEIYPASLHAEEIPLYLAKAKAACCERYLDPNTILITADTIVWLDNEVIEKPFDHEDAVKMLGKLSGRRHEVFTGVCIKTIAGESSFFAASGVWFRKLSEEEIRYYVENFNPIDKAGAYGVQEWIGYVGVEKIEGSYFNVMGLPVQQLYNELLKLI
jgi:septum formation protein